MELAAQVMATMALSLMNKSLKTNSTKSLKIIGRKKFTMIGSEDSRVSSIRF